MIICGMENNLVSIFTPSHDTKYLNEAFNSVINQSYQNWEWIIFLNGDLSWSPPREDKRVKIFKENRKMGVGEAKKIACSFCSGEYLLELDHDDILVSNCLEKIVDVFDNNPHIGFVYSNTAQIDSLGNREGSMFNPAMGWTYSEQYVDGNSFLRANSFVQYPSTVSYIWFAPNHVRSFRKDIYEQIGGYNENFDILDDQDIMCRFYQATDFYGIEDCLYLQRMHDGNTQRDTVLNERIQSETRVLYDQHIEANALAWSKRNNLLSLDLGSAHNKPEGYIGIDIKGAPGVDVVCDLSGGIPFEDNSVGVLRVFDFLEHFQDKVFIFNEMYRVLAHGGIILSETPSTDGRGAFQDPTHIAFYNENSFWYFTNEFYAKFVPEIQCKFQVSRLLTYFPSDLHRVHNIPYVRANLVAVKNGPRIAGELLYSDI